LSKPGDSGTAAYAVTGPEKSLSNAQLIALIRGVIGKGASFRFRAGGQSMSPFIRDGDILTLAPLRDRPATGDVVAFINPVNGRMVVHRLVAGEAGHTWQARGDNNGLSDGRIAGEDLLGKVSRVERAGRTVRLGLGAEKTIIAWLSRRDALRKVIGIALVVGRAARRVIA
jgi:hypothetical protein